MLHSSSRKRPDGMVVAEALDFPGAYPRLRLARRARLMIGSALEDLTQILVEDGKRLPTPSEDAHSPDADLIGLVPLSIRPGTVPR